LLYALLRASFTPEKRNPHSPSFKGLKCYQKSNNEYPNDKQLATALYQRDISRVKILRNTPLHQEGILAFRIEFLLDLPQDKPVLPEESFCGMVLKASV